MKVLYISQYFNPEVCAPSNRAYANVKYFADAGHDVTVLTEMPNHPQGVIFKGYKHKLFLKEQVEKFTVNRVWVFTSKKKNFITRMFFYISFMILGIVHTILNWKKYDIVYVSSPPLFVAGIAIILKGLFPKTKIIFEVRDLWPDSAIELGELNNNIAKKLSFKLEKKIYNVSEKVIVISEYMKDKLIQKEIAEDKIVIVHNGADEEFITKPKIIPEVLSEQYKDEFTIVYAGNIGIAQNLELILEVAKKLKDENIKFLLVGDGPRREILEKQIAEESIDNIEFVGEIKRELIHEYLCMADLGIIMLKKIPLFTGALPSKIFDYMACDLPILLGVEGEAQKIIERSDTGISFDADDSDDLFSKIKLLKEDTKKLKSMSDKGNDYVLNNFNRTKQASKLENILKEVLGII